jgi:hypothetical protein
MRLSCRWRAYPFHRQFILIPVNLVHQRVGNEAVTENDHSQGQHQSESQGEEKTNVQLQDVVSLFADSYYS